MDKKACLIEIPFGCALVIPASMSAFLTEMHIVQIEGYDQKHLRHTTHELSALIFNPDRIKPIEEMAKATVAPPVMADPPPLSLNQVRSLLDEDLPYNREGIQ